MTITCSRCGNMFDSYQSYKKCPFCQHSIGVRNSDEANDHFDEDELEDQDEDYTD